MFSGQDQKKFLGKVVLVTGAGKGTGRSVAEMFAAQGATLAVNDVTPINLDETVIRILSAGGHVKAYVEDIAKKMPVQTLLNQVLDDFSRIDILANCAEVEPSHSILEMDEWDWQRTLDVNLTGPFLLIQSVGRIMRQQNAGIIVQLVRRRKKLIGHSAYFASRAGATELVKRAVPEFAGYGIYLHLAQTANQVLEVCSR